LKNNKYKAYHKKTQYILYFGLFLLLILSVIVAAEVFDISKIKSPFRESTFISIEDECSLIMGNLVHQIKDDDSCAIRCYNECNLIDSKVKDYEFIMSQSECSTCNCYCK